MARSYALQIIPSLRTYEQSNVHLASVMHSLVLDDRHPVALEIAGATTERSFIVRATSQDSLDHVATQLRARYPQAELRPLDDEHDPFILHDDEVVSAVELKAGSAAYLPLKVWDESQDGVDPILGVLAALDALPEGMRAVVQLGMVPAPANWSSQDQRKAVEHALEPERQKEKQKIASERKNQGAPGLPLLVLGALFLAGLLGYGQFKSTLPSWLSTLLVSQAWNGIRLEGSQPYSPNTVFLLVGIILLLLIVANIFRKLLKHTPIYDMRQVEQKTSQMAYRVRFRLYVFGTARQNTSPDQFKLWLKVLWKWVSYRQRKTALARLIAAYRQYHLASGNYFVPRRLSQKQSVYLVIGGAGLFNTSSGWWTGIRRSRHIISVDTVASLWHLPHTHDLSELALVEHRRVCTLPLPTKLVVAPDTRHIVGISEHAGHQFPFRFPQESLAKHIFIGGKSGEGKSTCFEHLAVEAMEQGGLVVIDPHGDLVDHIVCLVPSHRVDDVVLIDLSDKDYAIGFNPLDASLGRGRDKAVSDLLKTLAHIWSTSWGSRMENTFEYALRTLFEANKWHIQQGNEDQQYTLLDVMSVLNDEKFCHSLLEHIDDPFIQRWWYLYYDPLNDIMQRERSDPVLSKVAKFENQIARRIVGQGKSTINFAQYIQDEKIVLVKLAKGIVGDDVARLLGATLLGLLQITLEEQGTVEETQRKKLRIIIDEFQTLKGVDWAALAELRKYGAAFYLATQSLEYLSNMDTALLDIVLANVKQYIIFHMSAKDALNIHAELGVESEDILNLGGYMCYVKIMSNNHRQPTFSMTMSPPPVGNKNLALAIRTQSRLKYTSPAPVVDDKLRIALLNAIAARAKTEDTHTNGEAMEAIKPVGLARQQNGYRGRKSHEKREKQ